MSLCLENIDLAANMPMCLIPALGEAGNFALITRHFERCDKTFRLSHVGTRLHKKRLEYLVKTCNQHSIQQQKFNSKILTYGVIFPSASMHDEENDALFGPSQKSLYA